MQKGFRKRPTAVAAAGPFEQPVRARTEASVEAIAGAAALIAAFLLMTGFVVVRALG